MNFSGFINKVTYALSANVLSLLVSVVTTLVIPKMIGAEEFGYFQLYLFYSSYVGLLHFGWNNGVLLRLGGSRYEGLPKDSIFSQFLVLVCQQFLAAAAVCASAILWIETPQESHVLFMTGVCVLVSGPMYMLIFLLQATARIAEYARVVMIQRVLFGGLAILLTLSPFVSFEALVYAELLSRGVALGILLYICREMVIRSLRHFRWPKPEIIANIRDGFPLMLSSMAGTMIIGVVRFGIATTWSISVFGKVSLALSLATMVLTAIVSVGQVLFPLLRRASAQKLPKIYTSGRTILSYLTLPALFVYFILEPLVTAWLPEYSESVYYLGLIFPLFIYQVRSSVLLEPYLKALNRPRTLLWINTGVLTLSVLTTWLTIYIFHSLAVSLVSIVLLVAIRSYFLERAIPRDMRSTSFLDLLSEAVVVGVFLFTVLFLPPFAAVALLGGALLCWVGLHRKKLPLLRNFLRAT